MAIQGNRTKSTSCSSYNNDIETNKTQKHPIPYRNFFAGRCIQFETGECRRSTTTSGRATFARITRGTRAATTGARTRATRGPTASIRHNGRKIRPTAGTAAITATISGSAIKASSCDP